MISIPQKNLPVPILPLRPFPGIVTSHDNYLNNIRPDYDLYFRHAIGPGRYLLF
jgi:hypothetical protein